MCIIMCLAKYCPVLQTGNDGSCQVVQRPNGVSTQYFEEKIMVPGEFCVHFQLYKGEMGVPS